MNYIDPESRDQLAAEYALGTLSGSERERFQELLSSDRALRGLVEDWELLLSPLAESFAPVEPPGHVWDEIAKQIAPAAPAAAAAPAMQRAPVPETRLTRWWDSLTLWRTAAAMAATAAAVIFYAASRPSPLAQQIAALDGRLARIEQTTQDAPAKIAALDNRMTDLGRRINGLASQPTHVAVLLDKNQRPMMTADFDDADRRLVLRLNITPPRDFKVNVLEVWLVAPGGQPRSLGVFPSERPGTTTAQFLSHDAAAALSKAALAVSLEPRGGSTTGQPTGPVLFTGRLIPTL